ncbi:MAG: Hsp20/alpha crystallin family protein [Armatimonadetes bacterium]|nr:Hsp20/alpha crystallin family protein [Armatimonadota bacterium]
MSAVTRYRPGLPTLGQPGSVPHPLFRLSDAMRNTSWLPALDLVESADGFRVTLDVPGVRSEDIEVTFEAGNLVIRGEKRAEQASEDRGYRLIERTRGAFERAVRIGTPVDAESVSAECRDGVLTVWLPKAAEARPRQIAIAS